jgi:pilus assembly protein CpaE
VATNLALALARLAPGRTILADLHVRDGTADLLLDLRADPSWGDLLPVAAEFTSRQLDLVAQTHASGLRLLAGPADAPASDWPPACRALLRNLADAFEWVVLDSSTSLAAMSTWPDRAEVIVLVATADPPALRGAQRLLASLAPRDRQRAYLVLNQFGRSHPADPASIAHSLPCRLLEVLPTDPRAVGFQIHFGRPCALDALSPFGRAVTRLAKALAAGSAWDRAA